MKWERSEFLNKVGELQYQHVNEREISKTLGMNINDFRYLYCYFKYFYNDRYVNIIVENLKDTIESNGMVYINNELFEKYNSFSSVQMAIAVLKNDEYVEWIGKTCFTASTSLAKKYKITFRVLSFQAITSSDIFTSISNESWGLNDHMDDDEDDLVEN